MKHLQQAFCFKWMQYILASAGQRLLGIQQRMQSRPLSHLGNPLYLAEVFRLSLLADTSNQITMGSSGHIPVFHNPFTPVSTDAGFMKAVHLSSGSVYCDRSTQVRMQQLYFFFHISPSRWTLLSLNSKQYFCKLFINVFINVLKILLWIKRLMCAFVCWNCRNENTGAAEKPGGFF